MNIGVIEERLNGGSGMLGLVRLVLAAHLGVGKGGEKRGEREGLQLSRFIIKRRRKYPQISPGR